MMAATKSVRQPHIYQTFIYTCPVCLKETRYRERVYIDGMVEIPPSITHYHVYDQCFECESLSIDAVHGYLRDR